jgi:cellulose synthase/poly-beta-1,6-N-acetylglucosamine synthase-like glycosyltransferase
MGGRATVAGGAPAKIPAVLRAVFWGSALAIVYTHAGYPALLRLLARDRDEPIPGEPQPLPRVSVIIAAYDEEDVIEAKVRNVLSLDYPRDRLELIVCSDGSKDATVDRARAAGADLVLDLPRGGKVQTQDAGVDRASGDLLVFSDANSTLEPDALKRLVEPFADPGVGYACGQVRFVNEGGDSREGAYWRYEMGIRAAESSLAGITAGNGAIYAVRPEAYVKVDPRMGHDFSFPFNLTKRGWRCVYQPGARATEKMVPTNEGEFRRKRRMMSHTWAIVLEGGLLSPRGYSPLYAWELFSHRILRYTSPFLHGKLLAASILLAPRGRVYRLALLAQAALAAAAAANVKLARYYLLITASPALGLVDYLRTGTPAEWEKAEGTR